MNDQHRTSEEVSKEKRREALRPLLEAAEAGGLWLHHTYTGFWVSPAELRKKNAEGTHLFDPKTWRLRPPEERAKEIDAEIARLLNERARVLRLSAAETGSADAKALFDLADRVEREGPSFSLDSAISLEITGNGLPSLLYTSMVDAAATLTDWCIAHLSEIGGDGLPMCVLTNGEREVTGYCLNSPLSGTTALARALSAAGLRSRAVEAEVKKENDR